MTTIAYDGKTLVSDSQSSIGSLKYEDDCQKIFPNVGPFAALGVAGSYQDCMDIINVISEYNKIDHIRSLDFKELNWQAEMIGITHEGQVWHYSGNRSFELRPDLPYAVGSGADYALGAMAVGADATSAVLAAAQLDLYTNDKLQVATIRSAEDPEEEDKETTVH
jgi:ATP-dependent protease HslVU (ClpYQ) peptidase subunit